MAAAAAERDSKLQSMCRKTRLCKFHYEGSCTRWPTCDFAHGPDELKAPPDLSCTKLCPWLLSTGECDDPACKFAHFKDQLRSAAARGSKRAGARGTGAAPSAAPQVAPWTSPLQRHSTAGSDSAVDGGEAGSVFGGMAVGNLAAGSAALGGGEAGPVFGGMAMGNLAAGSAALAGSGGLLADLGGCRSGAPASEEGARHAGGGGAEKKRAVDRRTKFHKTKLCEFHMRGHCSKRGKCDFAHGEQELHAACQAMPRAMARASGRGDAAAGASGGARRRLPSREWVADAHNTGYGGEALCRRPSGDQLLQRLWSSSTIAASPSGDAAMCRRYTTSTLGRSNSWDSASDHAAWVDEVEVETPEETPFVTPLATPQAPPLTSRGFLATFLAGYDPPQDATQYQSPPATPCAASPQVTPWSPTVTRSLSAADSEEEDGGGGYVTLVKNTFITVRPAAEDARRRSKSVPHREGAIM